MDGHRGLVHWIPFRTPKLSKPPFLVVLYSCTGSPESCPPFFYSKLLFILKTINTFKLYFFYDLRGCFNMTKISIFGTGYVGLIAGVCFAKNNNKVICVDVDLDRIEKLKQGIPPIYEPGLTELLNETISKGMIEFTQDSEYAVKNSKIHFICVGTPTNLEDGSADLKYVFKVAETIGKYIDNYAIIVDKSTVPVGTGKKVKSIINNELLARKVNVEFDVVSNPEFLREGSSVKDFLYPDRIVIGTESDKAAEIMQHLYEPMTRNGNPIIVTKKMESAELIKYGANAFLANKIAFINELARLTEAVGADIREVTQGMGTDSRISPKFMYPGPGYGGSCFPKDTKALAVTGREYNSILSHVERTIESNEEQKEWCAKKILKHFDENVKGKTFGIWGLAFKANTDDMRDSSSITIINRLLERGANVRVHDPEAMKNAKMIFGDKITYCENKYEVLNNCDAFVIMTEWPDYRVSDFQTLQSIIESLKEPVIFDFRNLYDKYKDQLKEVGIRWYGIGITQ